MNMGRRAFLGILSVLFLFLGITTVAPPPTTASVSSIGPPGGAIRSIAVLHDNLILAGSFHGKLFLTNDGGQQWLEISPDYLRKDHVIEDILVQDEGRAVFIAVRSMKDGFLMRARFEIPPSFETVVTTDWQKMLNGNRIRSIAVSGETPPSIYAGTDERVFISTDDGQNWTISTFPFPDPQIESLVIDPNNPDILYAGSWQRPFKSLNRGKTWQPIHSGMAPDSDVFAMVFDAHQALYAGTCGYVYRSENRGVNWTKLQKGLKSKRMHVLKTTPEGDLIVGSDSGVYLLDQSEMIWKQIVDNIIIHDIDFSQDHQMICATEGHGLIRVSYPSGEVTHINLGINASSPVRVFRNSDNNLVAAIINQHGSNGIWIRQGLNWERLQLDGLTSEIQDIHYANGVYYIGTPQGLFIYARDESGWFHVQLQSGKSITRIFFETRNSILIATTPEGLLTIDLRTSASRIHTELKDTKILSLWASPQPNGPILVGTIDGLMRFYPDTSSWVRRARQIEGIPIYDIISHPNESVMYLATGDGIYQTDNLGDTIGKLIDGFPDLACIAIARSNTGFAALFASGDVFQKRVEATRWSFLDRIRDHAWYIARFDDDPSVYIGTDGAGLLRLISDDSSTDSVNPT